ncbi:UNVERIFIED_CONTAM: hypothetical protein ABIC26_002732 [Paenibacillus sp. PvR008]
MGTLLKLQAADEFMENKSARDQYINKVEVLNKVKSLSLLPDNQHMTTKVVADYYEVEYKTIASILARHKKELENDGVHTITSKDEAFLKLKKALPSSQFIVKLLTKKAVLRIGMLLKDSEVAVKVRDYLLRVEEVSNDVQKKEALNRWTIEEIEVLNGIIEKASDAGKGKMEAMSIAAKVLKRKPLAIYKKCHLIIKNFGSIENYIRKEKEENDILFRASDNDSRNFEKLEYGIKQVLFKMDNINKIKEEYFSLKLAMKDIEHKLLTKEMIIAQKDIEISKNCELIEGIKSELSKSNSKLQLIRNKILQSNPKISTKKEVEEGHMKYTIDQRGIVSKK